MKTGSLITQTLLATARQEGAVAEARCLALLERAATGRELQAAFQRELARAGLTESGFGVLVALFAHGPQAVLRADLALAAGLSPMRTDDALFRLELSGLVRRQRDAEDRRLVWLQLTPEGRARTTDAIRRYIAGVMQVTESLNPQEVAASTALSAKLRAGAAQLSRGNAA